MAALGKIRSKGGILVGAIGLALFAFLAGDAARSCDGIKGEARQQIGEILGKKISVQDYQKLIDEYQSAIKFTMQRDNLTDQELKQVEDQVWQQLVSNRVIEADAEKVGLTVTEKEIQNVLNEGTNPMLVQTPFVNQQTGRFDVNALKQFFDSYNKAKAAKSPQVEQMQAIYDYWLFVEKNLRAQLLGQKYQALLASCVLSNKAEAKMAFKDNNEESQIQLASLAYSTVKDADVKVTDDDLKAKYAELKPAFRQNVETRDIKFVDFQIKASAADRSQVVKEMNDFQKQLASAKDPAAVVSKSGSEIPYLGLPVSNKAYQQYPDIASKIDSLSVGTTGVVENAQDNTLNIIRVLSKAQLADSIQFRQINIAAATPDEARAKADSIQKALAGGADFDALAKRYGQTGEKVWFTGQQYEMAPSMNQDNRTFINALLNGEVNATQNLALTQGNIILQVLDKKAFTTKTTAAVIKKVVDFSKATRSNAYNKFSEFVAKSSTVADLEKNAPKSGYQVQSLNDISTAEHYVGGIPGTRDALKWLFEAKQGEVSPLYECGNNDHLLVIALTAIHPQGYRSWDDAQVKEILKREVIKDKKAEKLMAKLKGVNSIAAAQAKGAKVSSVNQITFAAPAFVQATGSVEPALSGAVAGTAAGKFSKAPVKGNAGVYVFQVVKKSMRAGSKYDETLVMQQAAQANMQLVGNFMQDLILKAKVVDNRYLFF
ncbi:peptidylprolyl isomerase [Prevotella melaninogenica]|uniref:peptidylprolyl isomerase n=1 Tax=Prevotella melaninogenica TaxID=28132 RepID=UPI001C5F0AA0|nr:peptidylprolyl isomerase [Prevotella melaninogenica]MBW4733175.1 SurA N-terminal domain-containing protein [Prevotella melaninogenica]MBW4735679.1 SurA N-terminal domain-containing protein [Prevotella melaninogenica]MBW4878213.1 SurA N-terminal domain-containing protein [Prevotella melaninogenica]